MASISAFNFRSVGNLGRSQAFEVAAGRRPRDRDYRLYPEGEAFKIYWTPVGKNASGLIHLPAKMSAALRRCHELHQATIKDEPNV